MTRLNVDYRNHPDSGQGLSFSSELGSMLFASLTGSKKILTGPGDFILAIDNYLQQQLSRGHNEVGTLSTVLTYLNMNRREYQRRLWEARVRASGRKEGEYRNYDLTLYPEFFDAIRNGVKTVEGRAYSDENAYHEWCKGDTITFTRLTDTIERKRTDVRMDVGIKDVNHYETVREMLEQEGWKTMQPNVNSLKEAIGKYYAIDDSYEDRIQAEGIFAIQIELL